MKWFPCLKKSLRTQRDPMVLEKQVSQRSLGRGTSHIIREPKATMIGYKRWLSIYFRLFENAKSTTTSKFDKEFQRSNLFLRRVIENDRHRESDQKLLRKNVSSAMAIWNSNRIGHLELPKSPYSSWCRGRFISIALPPSRTGKWIYIFKNSSS